MREVIFNTYPKQTFLINFLHFFDKHPNTQTYGMLTPVVHLKIYTPIILTEQDITHMLNLT